MNNTEIERAAKNRLSQIADRGYALVLGLGTSGPRNALTTYPTDWTEIYMREGMMNNDPVLGWVAQNAGHMLWKDFAIPNQNLHPLKFVKQALPSWHWRICPPQTRKLHLLPKNSSI